MSNNLTNIDSSRLLTSELTLIKDHNQIDNQDSSFKKIYLKTDFDLHHENPSRIQ